MSEETTQKVLKIELGFDEEATTVLEEMKAKSKTKSTELLVHSALRLYDWYLREGKQHQLYQKRGEQWVKIDLKF